MGVGGGTGNTISFSEIRDFYGDSNPVVFSEFNRKSSNDGLVDATFAGASTATTGTSSQTVDDFAVTVTEVDGSLVNLTTSGSNQADAPFPIGTNAASFTLLNTTSFVNVVITGNGTCTFSVNNSQIGSVSPGGSATSFTIRGPQYVSGDRTLSVNTAFSAGDVFSLSCTQGSSTNTSIHGVRAIEYDITFQNNNSTGDTYNLTSNSTGGSSKTAYAAGDSFLAQDNGSSNQFVLAYDNVTGAGAGTAGDIGVSILGPNYTGSLNTSVIYVNTQVSGGVSYTITADDAIVSLIGAHPSGASDENPTGTWRVMRGSTVIIGPTTLSASGGEGTSSYFGNRGSSTYHANIKGPAYQSGDEGTGATGNLLTSTATQAGDVVETTSHTYAARVSTRRRDAQYTTRFTNNSGSNSYTIGSSSTGGAATIAASATRDAKTDNTSSNPSWAIHFDTSSGDCNVGIPTTIGSGNPANINLFNTVTTPVG